MLKKFTAKIFIGYLFILLLSQLFSGCMSFRMSDNDLKKYFVGHGIPKQHRIQILGKAINYAEIGNDSLPVAFFVHGSPGSWSAFAGFMKDSALLQKVKIVSVDRIGFGYSDFGKGEKSLAKQVAYLKPIVAQYKAHGKKIILIGHSLGGPLIARMAIDYPELIDNLVFVAGSIDPALEPSTWYRYILDFVGVRYLVPKSFRASNDEIIYLKQELEAMLPLWQSIRQPCIVIQGAKDILVDPQNAAFAKRMLTNAESVEIWIKDDMNHFVPWSNPELINKAILKSIER